MKNWSYLMLAGLLAACSGEKPVTGDDDDDTTNPGDDDDTTDTMTMTDSGTVTTDSGTVAPDYIDPVAVGFYFDGVLRQNGTIEGYSDGTNDFYPVLILAFAGLDYFEQDDDTDVCYAATIPFDPVPTLAGIPTSDNAALYWSYELALPVEDIDCAGRVDPATWGANAEDLVPPFDGAHFGLGFGMLSDNVINNVLGPKTLADPVVINSLFSEYIAINDAAGDWVGEDWTIGIAIQWDEATRQPVVDQDGFYVRADVSGFVPPDPLPDIYVLSSPWWYQDFPLMDFDNLAD